MAQVSVRATASQVGYLHWMLAMGVPFYHELGMWVILTFTFIVNLGSFAYLLDDGEPLRLWLGRDVSGARP